jgi:hypothetical protein
MITAKIATDRASNGLHLPGVLGFQATGLSVFSLNGFVHLLPVHADLDWCGNAQSDLITSNVHHGDDDVISYDDTFVSVT